MFILEVSLKERPSHEEWDLVSGLLFHAGCAGIDEGEEPLNDDANSLVAGTENEKDEFLEAISPGTLNAPLKFKVFFEQESYIRDGMEIIGGHLLRLSPAFVVGEADEKIDYSESWKENFKPLFCPPYWLVRAEWHKKEQLAEVLNQNNFPKNKIQELIIEPGMAFGTGNHDTTRSCLTLLTEVLEKRKGQPTEILDFGCGSGILSIGAKLMDPKNFQVLGVDIDSLALKATEENAKRNSISIATGFSVPETSQNYDLIIANILKNTLLEFSKSFQKWLKPRGDLILSGLLASQVAEVRTHFEGLGFQFHKEISSGSPSEEPWSALHFLN